MPAEPAVADRVSRAACPAVQSHLSRSRRLASAWPGRTIVGTTRRGGSGSQQRGVGMACPTGVVATRRRSRDGADWRRLMSTPHLYVNYRIYDMVDGFA